VQQSKPRRMSSLTPEQKAELKAYRANLIVDARIAGLDFTVDCVAAHLYDHKWTFAKTMSANPHWYTVRHDWKRGAPHWHAIVQYIRDNGRTMRFGKSDYTVWDLNGYRYWSMGDHLDRTMVINRAMNVGEYAAAAIDRRTKQGHIIGETVGP
jgi:hypothetical protein